MNSVPTKLNPSTMALEGRTEASTLWMVSPYLELETPVSEALNG